MRLHTKKYKYRHMYIQTYIHTYISRADEKKKKKRGRRRRKRGGEAMEGEKWKDFTHSPIASIAVRPSTHRRLRLRLTSESENPQTRLLDLSRSDLHLHYALQLQFYNTLLVHSTSTPHTRVSCINFLYLYLHN